MITVKVLKIRTPEKSAVIILNLDNMAFPLRNGPKDVEGIANSEDPDQTAPTGAV